MGSKNHGQHNGLLKRAHNSLGLAASCIEAQHHHNKRKNLVINHLNVAEEVLISAENKDAANEVRKVINAVSEIKDHTELNNFYVPIIMLKNGLPETATVPNNFSKFIELWNKFTKPAVTPQLSV